MSWFGEGLILLFAIAGMLLYVPTNRIKAPGRWFFHDTWLDDYIPLVPYFIIPYVALFPYMFITAILMWTTPLAKEFFVTIVIASWSAAFVWYIAPAGILRKREIGPDFFSRMIVWIYTHDEENNTFPSSHVFYALICSFYLILAFPAYSLLFAATGGLISISTVLVKQHHAADIVGGIAWAIMCVSLTRFLVA